MLKRCVSIVLLLALAAVSFQRYFVYAGFEMNHDYIAKNLCVNRNKPWLHCDGKCYFMRKIKQAEDNEKKQATKDNFSRVEISFFQSPVTFDFLKIKTDDAVVTHTDNYRRNYTSQYISELFRPPCAVA